MDRFDLSGSLSLAPKAGGAPSNTPPRRRSRRAGETAPPHNNLNNLAFPAWARPVVESAAARGGGDVSSSMADFAAASFSAGASLALLDQILRGGADVSSAATGNGPPFAGALRCRLALRAATASASILRLREDSSALRDVEHLCAAGADSGPAGRLHRLWRTLAARPARLDGERFSAALRLLDTPQAIDGDSLAAALQTLAGKEPNPLAASVLAASLVANALAEASRTEAEILALWTADLVLAIRLGWERPVPLLATKISDASLRRGANSKRPRPGDPQWPEAAARTCALAACDAHALAADLARRSEILLAAAPKLRAKGAGRVIDMLLDDDAVTPARAAASAGLSDRAARRLFDRLVEFGAVRELSGRPSFRLYGL